MLTTPSLENLPTCPAKMFSATVQPRTVFDSCRIMHTPCSCACAMVEGFQGLPLYSIVPDVAFCIPAIMEVSVDFPEPFSADQSANLPPPHFKIHAVERVDRPESFDNVLTNEYRFVFHVVKHTPPCLLHTKLYTLLFPFSRTKIIRFDSYFFFLPFAATPDAARKNKKIVLFAEKNVKKLRAS